MDKAEAFNILPLKVGSQPQAQFNQEVLRIYLLDAFPHQMDFCMEVPPPSKLLHKQIWTFWMTPAINQSEKKYI